MHDASLRLAAARYNQMLSHLIDSGLLIDMCRGEQPEKTTDQRSMHSENLVLAKHMVHAVSGRSSNHAA